MQIRRTTIQFAGVRTYPKLACCLTGSWFTAMLSVGHCFSRIFDNARNNNDQAFSGGSPIALITPMSQAHTSGRVSALQPGACLLVLQNSGVQMLILKVKTLPAWEQDCHWPNPHKKINREKTARQTRNITRLSCTDRLSATQNGSGQAESFKTLWE